MPDGSKSKKAEERLGQFVRIQRQEENILKTGISSVRMLTKEDMILEMNWIICLTRVQLKGTLMCR